MKASTCVLCRHPLDLGTHIDEGEGWRCHLLGPDGSQCECFLRKRGEPMSFYDLESRAASLLSELERLFK